MSLKTRMLNYFIEQTVFVIEGLEGVIVTIRDQDESVAQVRLLQRTLNDNLREYIHLLAADDD